MDEQKRPRAKGLRVSDLLRHVFLIGVSVATVGPLIWIVTLSFKTERELAANPFGIPTRIDLSSYISILTDEQMLRFMANSVITTLPAVVIVLAGSVLAGYSLARISFKGSNFLFILFILSDAVPVFVVLIPLFILIQRLGLSGSRWSLILPYAAMKMGISVFIMRGFFRSISTEMEDAAQIDGCDTLQMLWSVMLPLIRPGALVVVILNFISFWNEYFLAAVLLPSQDLFTLPAGLAAVFMGKYHANWPMMAAGIVISAIPSLSIFSVAQEKIIEAWTVTVR